MATTACGTTAAEREQQGRPISTSDAQVAATCSSRHHALATRSTEDFRGTGIELIDSREA